MLRPEVPAQQLPPLALSDTDYGESRQPHAARWRWLRSPAIQGLLALALYAAVWLPTVVRPLVSHPGRAQLLQTSPDPNFYVWSLGWWPHAIGHGLNPLFTNLIQAPAGHSLGWVTTVPPLGLLAAPLTLKAGPVVAFNLLTALASPLSAWAAFLACRRLTGRFWPALIAGAIYGFSDYELRHLIAGQINLCWALLPPLLAYLVVAWRDGAIRSWLLVILSGLLLAVQFYLFLETFADLTAVLLLSLLIGMAVSRRGIRGTVLRLAGLLGLGYLLAMALAAPYLIAALNSAAPVPPPGGSMDLSSLWLPTRGRGLGFSWLANTASHVASPGSSVGIPLVAALVALAITQWRSRLVWLLTALFAIITAGALGPVVYLDGRREFTVPWHGLFNWPFVRNAYPVRLMLFAYLILALATALLLAGVSRQWTQDREPGRWRPRWSLAGSWSVGALVVAFGLLNVPGSVPAAPQTTVPAFITSGDYHRMLAPAEIVMVVSDVGNAGMLWQADSNFYWRLAGGYINQGFDHRSGLPEGALNLDVPSAARVDLLEGLIKADHIGAILVDASHTQSWVRVFGIFGLTGHRDGGVIVYPTGDCRTCRPVTRADIKAASFPS
jgi:hypothetical protein